MRIRMVAALVGLVLGVAVGAPAAAQDAADPAAPGGPNNADGSYVVADDDGNPDVRGEGTSRVVGDINTGGVAREPIIYDEGATVPDVETLRDAADAALLGEDDDAEAALEPAPAPAPTEAPEPAPSAEPAAGAVPEPVEAPAATVSDVAPESSDIVMSSEDGEATEIGESVPAAPVPVSPAASSGSACGDYASWYDAQIAYEEAGGTAADPALVSALDPDADGIACEEAMATS